MPITTATLKQSVFNLLEIERTLESHVSLTAAAGGSQLLASKHVLAAYSPVVAQLPRVRKTLSCGISMF
jgi:hypothetical protein